MANLTNTRKERLKAEFVKYVDSQTVEELIRNKKPRETLLKDIILSESISIDALKFLTKCYNEMHKNNNEALDKSFEKLAVLAVLAGKTEKIIPKELVPYMAFHVGFAEENPTQGLLNDNNNSNLQNFAHAFRIRLNSKIIKENDTPLQNRRFDALGRLIQYNSQCSAVCFDGKQILVAFNELHNSSVNIRKVEQIETHTAKVFKYLQDYTTYTALPKEEQKNFLQQQNLSTQRKELLLDAAQYYYKNNSEHKDILPRILQELEKYPNNNQEVQQKVCKVTSASPKVVKAVARARRDLIKLEDALNPDTIDASKKFAPSIIEAIKQPYKIVLDGPLSDKAHAEMRIIQYIKGQLQDRNNQLSEEIYIGLSKLCCISCDLVINKETKNVDFHFTDKNKQKHLIPLNITTRGGNGVGYEWALIDAIRKNPDWLEDFLGKTAYEKYNALSEQEKKIAINGIVRYIGKGELKIKDTPLKINPKKEQRKDKENESLKKQRQKKLTTDTSSSEGEEKNEPRNKIIATAIYGSTFPATQIQPIISTIQLNVPTTLDAALEEIKKLQAEKNDAVKQLENQNLAFEKTKADLVYAQENTIKNLSGDGLYQELLRHPDISVEFLQRLILEKQQLNKKKK